MSGLAGIVRAYGVTATSGIAAAEGKACKDRTSKQDTREEGTTEDTNEEVAANEENDGAGGEDVQTVPAGSRVPLLLGGTAFLSVGGYAASRIFARSQPPVRGRRLLRN